MQRWPDISPCAVNLCLPSSSPLPHPLAHLPLLFQRRESLQHNICKRPQPETPHNSHSDLGLILEKNPVVEKAWACAGAFRLALICVFTLGRGESWRPPISLGALLALVCLARFYLRLSPLRQKLATCSFLAVCACGMEILL